MKKQLLILALVLVCTTTIHAQIDITCLPNGIGIRRQTQIDSFQINYPKCTRIQGNVDIYGPDITNLDSLYTVNKMDGDLTIRVNPLLDDLSGLSNVTSVGGLDIFGQNGFSDLSGLEKLDSIHGSLMILDTYILDSLNGLDSLSYVAYHITIRRNQQLKDISALSKIGSTVYYVTISDNDSLLSLNGLNNIDTVNGGFYVFNNFQMESLEGCESIKLIGSGFWLIGNDSLEDCSQLSNLTSVGEEVWIERNDRLIDFSGLENLTSIGGFLYIMDHENLETLHGLENLDSINGELAIKYNDVLVDISSVENIHSESIVDLTIRQNPLLSNCAIESICDYLADPNGEIEILSNAQNCNSQAEVEYACLVGTFPISEKDSQFSIYPNPTISELNYTLPDFLILKLNIYNQFGQVVLSEFKPATSIDVSSLNPGIYIVELVTNSTRFIEKIIIE